MNVVPQRVLKISGPALLFLLGGMMLVGESRCAATAAEVRSEALLIVGGGRAATSNYIQTDCIIGQGIIVGTGASQHYDSEPLRQTGLTYTVHPRSAAELWAFYE